MEYAIEQKVDIINLSLYAKSTLMTSVLKEEILKATDAGILVVGSAGNDGQDAAGYMPGAVEEAYIIGAAKEDGSRLETSNFGETVDYNVVAGSTSEAAALFTGYISANGIDAVEDAINPVSYTHLRAIRQRLRCRCSASGRKRKRNSV